MPSIDDPGILTRFSQLAVPAGSIALWWLGQSSFALRAGATNVLLDPFLSDNPERVPELPFTAEDCAWVDVVACTHDHIDHFDAPTIKTIGQVAPRARFVVPEPIIDMALDCGIARDRILPARPDNSIDLGDVTIHPVPACHGEHMTDAYTEGEQPNGALRFLGYVVATAGVTLYHSGDSIVFDGLVEALQPFGINLALLPINGRTYFREQQDLVGNMGPIDAAELAHRIGAGTLIPMHYDAFAGNLGYPDLLVQVVRNQYPRLSVLVPSRHQPFVYGPVT